MSEIWIADPQASTITVVSGAGQRVFACSEVLRSVLLPGFSVNLRAVFGRR